jgi:hypothetical protein
MNQRSRPLSLPTIQDILESFGADSVIDDSDGASSHSNQNVLHDAHPGAEFELGANLAVFLLSTLARQAHEALEKPGLERDDLREFEVSPIWSDAEVLVETGKTLKPNHNQLSWLPTTEPDLLAGPGASTRDLGFGQTAFNVFQDLIPLRRDPFHHHRGLTENVLTEE